MIKRVFEIILSITLLLLLSWLIVVLFVISSLSFKKIGFYCQKRIGKNNRVFIIFKIRSLYADEIIQANSFGSFIRKYKLDEIPQLLNILLGDMSFVGPRPELLEHHKYHLSYPKELLQIKPGLTGLASLYFFDENKLKMDFIGVDFEKWSSAKKNKLDMLYYKNRNICYDMKIIFLTLKRVIRI